MAGFWVGLTDRWQARYARPQAEASARVAGLRPGVVVTGGSSGIGLAIAREFVRSGAAVLLVARDRERLESAKAALVSDGARPTERVATLSLDVTAADVAARIEAALAERAWYLDVLVNCAGVGYAGVFEDQDPAELDRLLALNVGAVTTLTRHVVPAMRARGRGGVLNVASLGGYVPGPNQAAYYASKAYVCSLTEAVGAECAGSGVRVTVVAPGPVDTGFHARMGAENAFYRWLLPSSSAEGVARSACGGFRLGRRVVVPGVISTMMSIAVMVVPHWMTLPMLRLLLAPRGPK
jgi:uncharacterized protein